MSVNDFTGRLGRLGFATSSSVAVTYVSAVRNFSYNVTRGVIDATKGADSSGWREIRPGTASWTASMTCVALSTAVTHSQDSLRQFLSSESRRWWKVENSSGSSGYNFSGYAYVSGWDLSGDQEDIQLQNFSLEGDGKYVESST